MKLRTLLAAASLAALGASTVVQAADAVPPFYRVAGPELAGSPGTVIRVEPMGGAPLDAAAFRVLYRSTGLEREPVAVSGVVVVPAGPPPPEGWPIVAWAHPTTGVASPCAPSLGRFVFQTMQGLRELVARGHVVVATDYPGLGTPGPHPYLIGTSEGRAVLDSVRAARNLPAAGAGRRVVVWGHSQGGQAALYAGLLAAGYAPELDLLGVAAAAPATDLRALLRADAGTAGGRNLTAMALWSWSRVFDQPLTQVVDPAAITAVDRLASECLESIADFIVRRHTAAPLAQRFLEVADITGVEPWRSLLEQNTPGRLPPSMPVFLAQGAADELVRPAVTAAYMQALCDAGSPVRMLSMPGVGHGLSAYRSSAAAVDWIADRFAHAAAPNDCGRATAVDDHQGARGGAEAAGRPRTAAIDTPDGV